MRKNQTAIILAPQDDVHALTTAWEIDQLGGTAVILDTADYPSHWTLTMMAAAGSDPHFNVVTPEGRLITDAEISSVWWRRPRAFGIPESINDVDQRRFCGAEAQALLEGWIFSIGRRAINPLAAELAANRKPYQLTIAARCGLAIPRTLITNDPDAVRKFVADSADACIYKTLTANRAQVTETRLLDEADIGNLELLRSAPTIFQTRISGRPDVRLTVVDGQVFPAEIIPHHPEAQLDWRLDMGAEIRKHVLPESVRNAVLAYQRELGLRYGAYDFRRTEDGDYVFFEVNPGGQYLFVEIHAGLAISRALAGALLR